MKIDKIIKISLFMCMHVGLFANLYEGNAMAGLERKVVAVQGHDNNQERISSLEGQIRTLSSLHQKISSLPTFGEKLKVVSSLPQVEQFLSENRIINSQLQGLTAKDEYVVKALIALGQGDAVFEGWQQVSDKEAVFANLVELLATTEQFYEYMGGVIGYHVKTLQLIRDQLAGETAKEDVRFLPPPYVDIRKETQEAAQLIVNGLNALETMAEIHVVGGAGERLHLLDENTGNPLPVAFLKFCGRPLLEGLIRDLEAREYLCYKLTGRQVRTPIVLMTSQDKNNDTLIAALCKKHGWFGRPKESIFQLLQPLVPVITVEGDWALREPGHLVLKPGGHGVIWKLAEESGAFDWLQKQRKKFCIVRQINNPIAGLDTGLLAVAGYGYTRQKAFGVVSCPRLKNMTEGMNVLRQEKDDNAWRCSVGNIEYTEFAKKIDSDSQFKKLAEKGDFPANTNIIYANIDQVIEATKKMPIPGLLVNMKQAVETLQNGKKVVLPGARLESTMQNITDAMDDEVLSPLTQEKLSRLRTFVLLNDRSKTMSVTKKVYNGSSLAETPEGCFYDLIKENCRLLKEHCHFSMAEMNSPESYMKDGPSMLFLYHPALGPLYSIIAQKLSNGSIAHGSELQIEAAEVAVSSLHLDGSLLITANSVTGAVDAETKLLEFGENLGRCRLENVTVKNRGIDRTANNVYWKNQIYRNEALHIILEGNSEFYAKDIHLEGNLEIRVPDGERAIATVDDKKKVQIVFEPINKRPGLQWRYALDAQYQIILDTQ